MINSKEIIRRILIVKCINKYLVQPLILLKRFLPLKYVSRLPIIGTLCFKNCNGLSYKLYANGYDPIASEAFWTNAQGSEYAVIELLYKLGKKAEYLVDIGSNVGLISIHMNLLPSVRKVFSFEPLPEAFDVLKKNLELNNFTKCFAYKIAVGNTVGTTSFYVPNVKSIPSSSSLDSNFYMDNKAIDVEVTTLDLFAKENQIEKIDIVKIDVEGKEIDVLEGMQNILSNQKPLIFCEILNTHHLVEISNFIKFFGYCIYHINKNDIFLLKDLANFQVNDKYYNFILSPEPL